ncbi:hypothetical protein ACFWMU_22350 [Streptomyces sp. NPDC058357]|uniref:hypothetical protein n=1 Tax=unclassified Streptomyces TaxID=2593676 RepID=UPI00364627E7
MADGSLRDITTYDRSPARGEGDIISTTGDVDGMLAALFSGELLPPELSGLLFTLPPDDVRMLDGSPARYSTGLQQATVNGVTRNGEEGRMIARVADLLTRGPGTEGP